ncbi:MAG TPA: hypothetical protein VLG38_06865, partial [Gammaproteobacteria bacterium]|nr:hypothetical protein [Gammaproteobacteria bacterium]
MIATLSVEQRIAALQAIFADFGIPILPNSSLDLAIRAEFGRGKRSKLTQLLTDLHQESDAGKLAMCIGAELEKGTKDPQILAVANVLQQRLPALLAIVDVRQSTVKREQLLAQLLEHFTAKIPPGAESDRTLRMLSAAQKNLLINLQVQAAGQVAEQAGIFCNLSELKRFGKILQMVTPALLVLDQPDYPVEQKVNHCVNALRCLSIELRSTKLASGANILDNIHWLAKVALPEISDKATVEQALQKLGISVGLTSTQILQAKAAKTGLTAKEIVQIIYASAPAAALLSTDQELLDRTQENQQYAAICGFLAKIAQDVQQPELAKISIAGICMASMRQTFYELKTRNLAAANFSESLGTILVGVGAITHNDMLAHVGSSILAGVSTYAGIMAVPGGAAIAIPLAVCSVLGKLFLEPPKENNGSTVNVNDALCSILNEVLALQMQMRHEFADLYKELAQQHSGVLIAIDHAYSTLASLMRYNNAQILSTMRVFDQRLQDIQIQITQEFTDLYLEYVHDPLEEVDYVTRYGAIDTANVQDSKHKLAMWLLYKSKHPKVNGRSFSAEQLPLLAAKLQDSDACLSLINRYVNTNFAQDLPEDIPHIPTWLQAAHAYALISATHPANLADIDEEQFLQDVLVIGNKTTKFVEDLAANPELWQRLTQAVQQTSAQLQARWALLQLQVKPAYLQDLSKLVTTEKSTWIAHPAAQHLQLEPFTPRNVDVSHLWHNHLQQHIPAEFLSAAEHGLGSLQISYAVEKSVNTFADLHIPYGHQLPDYARDVLFRIDVHFKPPTSEHPQLLTSTWLAYDLCDATQRFEQYYQRKFKYGLRHTKYHWISLDGLANQVEGHGNTNTQKLIDHD